MTYVNCFWEMGIPMKLAIGIIAVILLFIGKRHIFSYQGETSLKIAGISILLTVVLVILSNFEIFSGTSLLILYITIMIISILVIFKNTKNIFATLMYAYEIWFIGQLLVYTFVYVVFKLMSMLFM